MSNTLPAAPALGSVAPNTTRGTRASTIAPAHIAQGSSVTYRVASSTRQLPNARGASGRGRLSLIDLVRSLAYISGASATVLPPAGCQGIIITSAHEPSDSTHTTP